MPAAGERTLRRECPDGGSPVLATTHALLIGHGDAPDRTWRRIEWREIERVGQVPGPVPVMTLLVAGRTIAVPVGRRSSMPMLVTQLSASATVLQRRVVLGNQSVVTIWARRDPFGDVVTWSVEFAVEADGQDPELVAEAAAIREQIRAQAGC